MLYDKEIIAIALDKLYKAKLSTNTRGYTDTFVDEIKLIRINKHENMTPVFYNKGFLFVGQGRIINKYANKDAEINSTNALIISAPQNILSETFVYEREPLIAIYILFNKDRLLKIKSKLKLEIANNKQPLKSIILAQRSKSIQDVFIRLIYALKDEEESNVMGDILLDELYYRFLKSEYGYIFKELSTPSSSFYKINKILDIINDKLDENLSVENMANMINMSANTFHKLFKDIVDDSPNQYVKKLRLSKAKSLMLKKNMKALEASNKVGYNSISQFSREFKRYFGVPPTKVNTLSYKEF